MLEHVLVKSRSKADYVINCAWGWLEHYGHGVDYECRSRICSCIRDLTLAMQSRSPERIDRSISNLMSVQASLASLLPSNTERQGPSNSAALAANSIRVHRHWSQDNTGAPPEQINHLKRDTSQVFISYAHADSEWLSRLLVHLRPLERSGRLSLWHDRQIAPGDKWRNEIASSLANSSIAILMVTANFMASDFIYLNELPPLIQKARVGGVRVFPLIVGHCLYDEDEHLSEFQAFNDPEFPLTRLDSYAIDKIIVNLAKAILKSCY